MLVCRFSSPMSNTRFSSIERIDLHRSFRVTSSTFLYINSDPFVAFVLGFPSLHIPGLFFVSGRRTELISLRPYITMYLDRPVVHLRSELSN